MLKLLIFVLITLPVTVCYEWYPTESTQDTDGVLGSFITKFVADSQWQLIVDLDFLKSIFWQPTAQFGKSLTKHDESFIRQLSNLIEPLKEYDISAGCLADIAHFLLTAVEYIRYMEYGNLCTNCTCRDERKIRYHYQWVFNVLDAMGKVPPGILNGNNLWIGSWSACRRISVIKNRQQQRWSGQYCMASFQTFNRNNPLKHVGETNTEDPAAQCKSAMTGFKTNETINEDDSCFTLLPIINYGLCTPDSCTNYDVKKILELVYKSAESAVGRQIVCHVDIVCRNDLPQSRLSHDFTSLCVLFFVIFMGILIFFGTLYDYYVCQHSAEETGSKLFYSEQHWFIKILLAFSIYTNGKNILRTEKNDNQIHCLHGTRVLSMFWIILGHSYYYAASGLTADNLIPTMISFPKKFFNMIIAQAPLAVDSFFYLSGMLTSYIFMEKFKKSAAKGRSIFSTDMWALFYIHRYLRLTPVYLIVMILHLTLFTYVSDGPFWKPIESNYCRQSWWTNLIYMNNFLLQDVETCMGWTWYMANDMQFHLFSPILLILLYKSQLLGMVFGFTLITLSSLVHLFIILAHGYPPAPLLTAKLTIIQQLGPYWNDVYVKPYIRCNPYIIGILVGFSLHKCSLRPVIANWKMNIGWIISTILGLVSVFGLYNYARTGEISGAARILYALFGRNAYAMSLAWVTFACATGYGGIVNDILSWKAWIPLSRITFCAYLIHPILLQLYYLSRPQPFHFTAAYQMMYQFVMAVALSYFMGFFLSATFEIPVSILETQFVDKIASKMVGKSTRTVRLKETRQKETVGERLPMIAGASQVERTEDNGSHS